MTLEEKENGMHHPVVWLFRVLSMLEKMPAGMHDKIDIAVYRSQLKEDGLHALEVCWNWEGATDSDGYGNVKVAGATHKAHRVAFFSVHPAMRRSRVIDHLCRNRACVNPWHLEAVTVRENTLRGDGPTARLWRAARGLEASL